MNDAFIISLTESHLDKNILDADIKFSIQNSGGFDAFGQDRALTPKGGIINKR